MSICSSPRVNFPVPLDTKNARSSLGDVVTVNCPPGSTFTTHMPRIRSSRKTPESLVNTALLDVPDP